MTQNDIFDAMSKALSPYVITRIVELSDCYVVSIRNYDGEILMQPPYTVSKDGSKVGFYNMWGKGNIEKFKSGNVIYDDPTFRKVSSQSNKDGGPGSGNWGHEGREGKIGGSAPGGGVHNRITEEGGTYTSFSKKKVALAKPHKATSGEFENLPNRTRVVTNIPSFGRITFEYDAKSGWFSGDDGSQMTSSDLADACTDDGNVSVRVFIPNEASTNYNKLKQSFDVSLSRRAEAKTYSQPKQADKDLRKKTGEVWKTLTDSQKKALYDYTGGFFMDINHSLRSGHGTTQNQSKSSDITAAIAKSKTQEDMWLYRGVGLEAIPNMFGLDWEKIQKNGISSIVGMSGSDDGFMSCGTTSGTGYGDVTDVNMKIFVPKGSEALYAEPFSKFGGNPDAKNWNGESDQAYFSSEMETILQRGSHFQCTKAYYDDDKKKYIIEVAVTGQDYSDLNW